MNATCQAAMTGVVCKGTAQRALAILALLLVLPVFPDIHQHQVRLLFHHPGELPGFDFPDPCTGLVDEADRLLLRVLVGERLHHLDRHLATRGDQTALIWEGDDPGRDLTITYRDLHQRVCRFANALKELGAKKGDRITIYMPMIPEAAISMLACARIGAIHSVVFGAFSPDALRDRIQDSACKILITQDTALRGPKNDIPMKTNARRTELSLRISALINQNGI